MGVLYLPIIAGHIPGSEVNCEAAQFTVPPPRSMAVITHGSTTAFKQIHKAFVELHQELVG